MVDGADVGPLDDETVEMPPVRPSAVPVAETAVMPAVAEQPLYEAPQVSDVPPDATWPLVFRVLVLPRSTFRRLSAEAPKLWPLALGILLFTAAAKTGIAAVFAMRAGGVATPLARAVAVRYSVAILGPLLFAVAMAGLLVVAEKLWRGDASFGVLLSAVSVALMPLAVRNVIQSLYMALARTPLIQPGLSSLLGRVPGSVPGRLAYGGLGQIDLFTLWALVLVALAATVSHGRGWMRPVLTVALGALVWFALGMLPSFAVALLLAH